MAQCAHTPPDLVMASGPPFGEFVAGLVLSQRWRVPLVLDYRDEWTQCPFQFVGIGNTDWFWEPRCLRRAALVFFTTESQRTHQLRMFPGLDPGRTAVAPNGAHEAVGGERAATPASPATIAFLGLLGEHCDLDEFLATLGAAVARGPDLVDRVRVIFVGNKTGNEQRLLDGFSHSGILESIDHVPLSEAQAIMRRSAALLLLNPPRLARYIPGKAYDYIAARRRILLYGQGGELDQLLTEYPPAIRVERQHPDALHAALRRIADEPEPPASVVSPEFLARCSRNRNAEQQIIALERLLAEPVSTPAVA
jgi:hypothetical protein